SSGKLALRLRGGLRANETRRFRIVPGFAPSEPVDEADAVRVVETATHYEIANALVAVRVPRAILPRIPACGDIDSCAHAPRSEQDTHIPLDRRTFLQWLSRWWRGQHESESQSYSISALAPIQGVQLRDKSWAGVETSGSPITDLAGTPLRVEDMRVAFLERGPLVVTVEVAYQAPRPALVYGTSVLVAGG